MREKLLALCIVWPFFCGPYLYAALPSSAHRVHLLVGRQQEGECFPRAGLGDGDDVAVAEGDRPGLGLDRGRRLEPGRPETRGFIFWQIFLRG